MPGQQRRAVLGIDSLCVVYLVRFVVVLRPLSGIRCHELTYSQDIACGRNDVHFD